MAAFVASPLCAAAPCRSSCTPARVSSSAASSQLLPATPLSPQGRAPLAAEGRGGRAIAATAATVASVVCGSRRSAPGRGRAARARARRAQLRAVGPRDLDVGTTPVLLLGGFLGAGKTTLLKHWLERAEGKVGVIVNDVAAVNIDSELVKETKTSAGGKVETLQLQNGCACCSLGDEMMAGVAQMLQSTEGGQRFDYMVIELSGVAEPIKVQRMFEDNEGAESLSSCGLSKVVTLVDCSTFCENYMEYKVVLERTDLVDSGGNELELAGLKVVELLVEQVEAADVVVLNKTDVTSAADLMATAEVVSALNPEAVVMETSFGQVSISKVMSAQLSKTEEKGDEHGHAEGHSSSHCHDEGHASSDEHGEGHSCSSSSGEHAQGHSHSHDGKVCADANCTDSNCADSGHENGHSHQHSHGDSASAATWTTAQERFGITSFTYKARLPFSAERLAAALQRWPMAQESSIRAFFESDDLEPVIQGQTDSTPFARVIRSKGFCWINTSPSERMYWSHAGKSMLMDRSGVWWGCMSPEQLQWMKEVSPEDFETIQETWLDEWADRRQELVFIGQQMDEAAIRQLLDSCLLTPDELEEYRVAQESELRELQAMSGEVPN